MLHKYYVLPILSLLVLCIGSSARAEKSRLTFEYPMTIPYGETKDFISDTSYRGFGFSSFFGTKSNLSWGLSLQWINWKNTRTGVAYEPDGTAVPENERREIDAYPFLLQGRYEIVREGLVKPYIGLGIGPAYVEQYQRLSSGENSKSSTQGILSPELGFYMNFNSIILGMGAQFYDSFTAADNAQLQGLTIRLAVGFTSF
jgi:hypothetical protein